MQWYNHKGKCFDHLGNEYKNISEMCEYYNIKRNCFINRMQRGWSLEDALTKPVHGRVEDHLGNKYDTLLEMCKHYNIPYNIFKYRIRIYGWSLEDALTVPYEADMYRDHLGNEFQSIKDMCKHYKISTRTYFYRIRKGYTLEEALTIQIRKLHSGKQSIDHLGNTYESVKSLCDHYKIPVSTYLNRLRGGWTVEDALTVPIRNISYEKSTDHLGNKFRSVKEMCRYYSIDCATYYHRIASGMSLGDALTKPVKKFDKYYDHLGNEFYSLNTMCKHYGISRNEFCYRLEHGWSLEEALTTATNKHSNMCVDHLGNSYKSTTEMCDKYNISVATFKQRLKSGWSLEDALSVGLKVKLRDGVDHLGNRFPNVELMCRHYGIGPNDFYARIKDGWSLEDALLTPKSSEQASNNKMVRYIDHLGNGFSSLESMCRYWGISTSTYKNRLNAGLSIKDALTTPVNSKGVRIK